MTIQQHASFDSSAAELNATSKLVKAWESKNAKNAAKAGGISLMALSLAACGGSSTTTTTTATDSTTTTTTTATAVSLQATTDVDALSGGAGDDSFTAQMSGTATLNTAGLLDTFDGGAGTDSLTVVNTTTGAVATALTASNITNVETFNYSATLGGNLDFDTAGSATTFNLTVLSTSDFSDVRTTDTVTFANAGTAMNSTLTYNAADVTGASDSDTIALTSVTDGAELTLSGAVESMSLDVNGASRFDILEFDAATTSVSIDAGAALRVDDTLTGAGVTTYTVTGAGAVTLTPALGTAVTSYAAANATGAQTILAGATNITITTGSADDVVDMGATLTSNDTIDLGAGSNTLRVDIEGLTAGATDLSISNVDTLRLDGINTSGAIQMDNLAIANIRFDDATAANLDGGVITLTDIATTSTSFAYTGGGILDDDLFFSPVTVDYDTTTAIAAATFSISNGGLVADDMVVGAINANNVTAITINVSELGQAAADELTIADVVADNMTDLILTADGAVVFSGIDGDILDTIDFSAADGDVTAQLDDAAAAVVVTLGDGNDVFVATANSGAITIDLGAGTDAYTSAAGVDTITTGTGSDTITLVGTEADAANVIKDFTAGDGGDVIDFTSNDTSGQGTATLTEYAEYATAAAWATATAADTGDEGAGGVVVLGANVTAGTEAALITTINGANVIADIVTSTGAGATTDQLYVAADNGVDTFLFHVINAGTAAGDIGTILAGDTVTLLATFEGISDATTLSANNFADFIA